MKTYIDYNRANWDNRAPIHAASPSYCTKELAENSSYLSDVVRFDLPLLGEISDLRTVHLQCHIGTDTVSLFRLGARISGLDFSPASLAEARALAVRCGAAIDFVESDVYAAAKVFPPSSFDLVYTGIGALCWLPSIHRWAETVANLLKPGGRLFIREGHPILWSIDEGRHDGFVISHTYFEREEPTVWDDANTYVITDQPVLATVKHEWNHGLGEIITALLSHSMEITSLTEHDSIPWEALPGRMIYTSADGEWRLNGDRSLLPLSYTLQARKRGVR